MAEHPQWPTRRCESCPAMIVFATTRNLRQMPVDAEPADGGNVLLTSRGEGQPPQADVLPVAQQFGKQGRLHLAHFVTCPGAAKHRRPRARADRRMS